MNAFISGRLAVFAARFAHRGPALLAGPGTAARGKAYALWHCLVSVDKKVVSLVLSLTSEKVHGPSRANPETAAAEKPALFGVASSFGDKKAVSLAFSLTPEKGHVP